MNRLELLKSRFAAVEHKPKAKLKCPMRLFGGVWIPDQTRMQVPDRTDFKYGEAHPFYEGFYFMSFSKDSGSQIWRTSDQIKKLNTYIPRTPEQKAKRRARENKKP